MNQLFKFKIVSTIALCCFLKLNAQITLSTNVGNDLLDSGMPSCDSDDEAWAKVFELSDFGIGTNEQFIIESGQVALSRSYGGAYIGLTVFAIDGNFPNSSLQILGSVGGGGLLPVIDGSPQIIDINFGNPIVVPAGVERILVHVAKIDDFYNPLSSELEISSTAEDTGSSWYIGCRTYYNYVSAASLNPPIANPNFFINVTGRTLNLYNSGSMVTLSHNICDEIIETNFPSCSSGLQQWARAFYLSDFGISTNEEFIINSGQIGIAAHGGGATVTFHIYEIDDNFPDSFSESNLIGSSLEIRMPYDSGTDTIGQIFEIEFGSPILIDAAVERILVVAEVGTVWGSGVIFIGGTEQDRDDSWFRGCVTSNYDSFTTVNENYKFYITVTGDVYHINNNFSMNVSNVCSEFLKEFSITNTSEISSVVWDFGDPASGAENISTNTSPYHDFSADGNYTITAIVTAINGTVETLSETITVKQPPEAYGVDDIYACEDTLNSGLSSSFDTSAVISQVLGNQANRIVTFIDGSGNEYDQLPNPFSNTIQHTETIKIRVAREDELCCYSETTFDLITNAMPDTSNVTDLTICDENSNGFASFDLSQTFATISQNNPNLEIAFYHENGDQILDLENQLITNTIQQQEIITISITNPITNCSNETTFLLIVNPLPIAHPVDDLVGCDDNNDGISEYFDTSTIESQVLNGQTNMSLSYFDQNGNELPNPLPNPYTNTTPYNEFITVRVTNNNTSCYSETTVGLQTITQPNINQPNNIYACDQGNGYAQFDTSDLEQQITGNQTGLILQYFDAANNPLPSPLPTLFENTVPFSQTINVRVEDVSNPVCYSETSFELIVNPLPEIRLEDEYFICNLEPSITLSVNSGYTTYQWFFEDSVLISNTNSAVIAQEGTYTVTVAQMDHGINCSNSFQFNLIRSILPEIQEIKHGELGNNFIEIIASGDGDFEYSLDGSIYQDSNYFSNVQGGIYTVYVRDKNGCGIDSKEVVIVDYPKFFTPNNDGYNDHWHIKGISLFPNAQILIFDRYGKLLKQLNSNDLGWDGNFNGQLMMGTDYWFTANLGDGQIFSGHFSLKR